MPCGEPRQNLTPEAAPIHVERPGFPDSRMAPEYGLGNGLESGRLRWGGRIRIASNCARH